MSDGKGKGRATTADGNDAPASQTFPTEASLPILDRVISSATGLGRSLLSAPNIRELQDASGAASGVSGKPQASPRTNGNSRILEDGQFAAGSSVQGLGGVSSFRTLHHDEHVKSQEAEFSRFLDGIDPFTPSSDELEPAIPPQKSMDSKWKENLEIKMPQQMHASVEQQQMRDGEEVLALLNDHDSIVEDLENARDDGEVIDWGLTEEQRVALRALVNEIFPLENVAVNSSANHDMNLIPNLSDFADEHERQIWMEQWHDVLTRYVDEVWGHLLPLVQVAREEIEVMETTATGSKDGRPVALRRLANILGHLRKAPSEL